MAAAPGTDFFSLMNDPFTDLSDCEDLIDNDFGDIFDSLDVDANDQRAVLLELSEEMALITAELQSLKEDSPFQDYAQTAVVDPLFSLKKRARNGSASKSAPAQNAPSSGSSHGKRRKTNLMLDVEEDLASGFVRFMSKEELLNTITQDLHPRYLEGVIRIVNPSFDPATATDDDLEFDINLLSDDVLYQLMQYVRNALETSSKESAVNVQVKSSPVVIAKKTASTSPTAIKRIEATRPRPAPIVVPKRNVPKKEGPRQRLLKRAPKKRTASRPIPSAQQPKKQQQPQMQAQPQQLKRKAAPAVSRKTKQQIATQVQYLGGLKKKNNNNTTALVSSDLIREIFQSEEIIRVRKCLDEEEEDEEVDILGF